MNAIAPDAGRLHSNAPPARAAAAAAPGPAASPAPTSASGTSPALAPQLSEPAARGWWRHAGYVLSDNPITLVAAALFATFLLLAAVGPWLAPYDPLATGVGPSLQAPSARHWFGTDALGRDIFSRVLVATRLDLAIAFSAVAASFLIGGLLGAAAGYFGGWTERVVMRGCDMVMSFPLFVLAMGIVAALGNSVANIILATAVVNLPFYIRVARTEVNVRREAAFVEAARLAGNGDARILLRHLIPNALPPMMVQVSLNLGWAILNAAGLSFIGLGVAPPAAEWGIMVAEGAAHIISGEWWVSLFPGAVLMLAVFTFNLLGDGLRDLIDPRRRT
jgi:peptide/nickel transport system permease protein